MKKVLAALVVLGLTSFAFAAADANKSEKNAENPAKAKKAKAEKNATK